MSRIVFKNNELDKAQVKFLLMQNGLKQIYEMERGEIVVKETDVVQVTVTVNDGNIVTTQHKFIE